MRSTKVKNMSGGQETKGPGLHNSQIADSTMLIDYLLPFQNVGENCLLCPQEKLLDSDDEIIKHYRCVHISRLINIHQVNILMCCCSEVRSRGTDNSVRNRHYHCLECWHPFDTKVKLRVHIIAKHSELYTLAELQHWAPGRDADKKRKKKKNFIWLYKSQSIRSLPYPLIELLRTYM